MLPGAAMLPGVWTSSALPLPPVVGRVRQQHRLKRGREEARLGSFARSPADLERGCRIRVLLPPLLLLCLLRLNRPLPCSRPYLSPSSQRRPEKRCRRSETGTELRRRGACGEGHGQIEGRVDLAVSVPAPRTWGLGSRLLMLSGAARKPSSRRPRRDQS
ncbi:hypothetical protein T492DRAFT_407202 [Pavlovales sp. CCMP2436]|nr:hypothetical protein T492DRAFT_407202 [Pavlovales sp. CCMP2436]